MLQEPLIKTIVTKRRFFRSTITNPYIQGVTWPSDSNDIQIIVDEHPSHMEINKKSSFIEKPHDNIENNDVMLLLESPDVKSISEIENIMIPEPPDMEEIVLPKLNTEQKRYNRLALRNKNVHLQCKLHNIQKRIECFEKDIQKQKDMEKKLKDILTKKIEQETKAKQEIKTQVITIEELQNEQQKLQNQLRKLTQTNKDVHKENQEQKDKLKEQYAQYNKCSQCLYNANKEIKELTNKNHDLQNKLKLSNEKLVFKEELCKKYTSLYDHSKKIQQLQKEIYRKNNELNVVKRILFDCINNNNNDQHSNNEIEKIIQENIQYQQQIHELKHTDVYMI
jgi:chromosome segregation ATPase